MCKFIVYFWNFSSSYRYSNIQYCKINITGLPHLQGIFKLQKISGKFWFFQNFMILKISGKAFLDLEWDLVNLVQIYCWKNWFYLFLSG